MIKNSIIVIAQGSWAGRSGAGRGRWQWGGGDWKGAMGRGRLGGGKGEGEKRILYIVSSTRLHHTVTHNICL